MSNAGNDLIEKARKFATVAHAGQTRKDGIEPYVNHPERVAAIVARLGIGDAAVAASWLHDTVEDTGTTQDDIYIEFGELVGRLVHALTDTYKMAKNRGWRKVQQVERMRAAPRMAQIIKLADRLDNLRSIAPDADRFWRTLYLEETATLLGAIGHAHPELTIRIKAQMAASPTG